MASLKSLVHALDAANRRHADHGVYVVISRRDFSLTVSVEDGDLWVGVIEYAHDYDTNAFAREEVLFETHDTQEAINLVLRYSL